jgi:hypothetical protein
LSCAAIVFVAQVSLFATPSLAGRGFALGSLDYFHFDQIFSRSANEISENGLGFFQSICRVFNFLIIFETTDQGHYAIGDGCHAGSGITHRWQRARPKADRIHSIPGELSREFD